MADTRFTLLSFVLGLVSSLMACIQLNLSLLTTHADYLSKKARRYHHLSIPFLAVPDLRDRSFSMGRGGGVELGGGGIPKASGKFRCNYRCISDLHDHLPPPPSDFPKYYIHSRSQCTIV